MEGKLQRLELSKMTQLNNSKTPAKTINYQQKLVETSQTNCKLKELMEMIKRNTQNKKTEFKQQSDKTSTEQLITKLKKKHGKLLNEIQHLTNNLNVLINQNNKLKSQVDSSRNSRVIYSNVYKTLEKQIRKNQYLYKLAIIENLCFEETEVRVKERLEKTVKKLDRQISQLQGIRLFKKKDQKKGRLDTGLSTFRCNKLDSKDTNRNTVSQGRSNKMLQSKRDELIHQTQFGRKDAVREMRASLQGQLKEQSNRVPEIQKTQKSIRTRNKIPLEEELNEYYDLQMKSNYYDNILAQLQKICGEQSLSKLSIFWTNIDKQVEEQYTVYLEKEELLKTLEAELQELEKKRKVLMANKKQFSEKNAEQVDLDDVQEELRKQRQKLNSLETTLTQKIDINCSRLTDDEISHHILRIKRRGEANSRQLQKLLENISKEKSNSNSLMASRLSVGHR